MTVSKRDRAKPVGTLARFGERPERIDELSLALCRRCDREVWIDRERHRRAPVLCERCVTTRETAR